jgi:hypothetical protein
MSLIDRMIGTAATLAVALATPSALMPHRSSNALPTGNALPVSAAKVEVAKVLPASAMAARIGTATKIVVARPKAPVGLPRGIEPLARYVPQDSCAPAFRAGTLAVGRLLVRTYPNTSFGGDYACGTDGGRSEHYEGRAIDWMNSVRDARQKAQADAVIKFLLATDKYGSKFANARRMGVMYLIWNNRIWSSGDQQWSAYNNCAKTPSKSLDSACHRNHMHFSLSWNGALGRTSFFSKHVFTVTDYGPCRVKGLNWAGAYRGRNTAGCTWYPTIRAPAHASTPVQALVRYSGITLSHGARNPAVVAIQQVLKVPVTSAYDARTIAAVNAFKRRHKLRANGALDVATWRALMAAYAPKAK